MLPKNNKMTSKSKLVVILGPTASGKTALSLKLAKKFNGEIISADSRAIYKGLDIGSAKPGKKEMAGIPHHLIDVATPDKTLTLSQYKKLALAKINDRVGRYKLPFLVGGTALYIYSVIDNWLIPEIPPNKKLRAKLEKQDTEKLWKELAKKDPKAKRFVDPKNKRRIIRALEVIAATGKPFSKQRKKGEPLFDTLILGVNPDAKGSGLRLERRRKIKENIAKRTKQMLKAGLVEEVKEILKRYHPKSFTPYETARACPERSRTRNMSAASYETRSVFSFRMGPALSGIHYKEIIDYLNKKISLPEAIALINKNDEQLVRRQMQWFKKDKRIRWVKSQKEGEILVKKFIK